MKRISSVTLILLFTAMVSGQTKKGYEISFTINGLKDSTIYLAYHLGDRQYLKDSVKIDKSGHGVFAGNELLPEGIYMIVLPGRKYFEVLIPDDQVFSVTCNYPEFIKTLKFSGSDENSAFIDYQKKWVALQEQGTGISTRLQNNRANKDSVAVLLELRKNLEDKMKTYLSSVAENNPGTLLAMLVKAILPVEMPPVRLPAGTVNPDSVKRIMEYVYNKDHFFDNIDLKDERLIRTPILQGRLNDFFTNVVIPAPDSINKEIDRLIAKCTDYKVFQFVSVFLFNHFRESEIMGHDAVMVKIADDIYLSGKADWTTQAWRDNLKKEVDRLRPNLIGVKGHDLVMDSYTGKYVSLYDIDKDFTILYFWEPDCGHCQEATPKLKTYYDKARNEGIEVFAVCTQSDKAKWEKYIKDNNLNWINGWDPKRLTSFDYYYNVQSTPTVYILDRNKMIIAKKLPVESIAGFIENWRKYKK
jgi:thiol-disulfide isomerase/thioredoxin